MIAVRNCKTLRQESVIQHAIYLRDCCSTVQYSRLYYLCSTTLAASNRVNQVLQQLLNEFYGWHNDAFADLYADVFTDVLMLPLQMIKRQTSYWDTQQDEENGPGYVSYTSTDQT
jgi:hypothetical protein